MEILVLIAIPAAMYIGWYFRGLTERIKRLERAARSRLPYRASEGIEDELAVLIDAEFAHARIEKALAIARAIRAGTYDPETPAGKRES